ncbi:MAG: prolyl oligopeptidase family serine peptidase [Planctomycetota bacterium]
MKKFALLLGVTWGITFGSASFAQQAPDQNDEVVSPRALTIADADDWESIRQFVIAPNGKWSGHFIMPNEGDGTLIIQKTGDSNGSSVGDESQPNDEKSPVEKSKPVEAESKSKDEPKPSDRYEFVVGPNSGRLTFSHDAKFAAYLEAPKDRAAKAAKKSNQPLKNKVVLMNLETGQKTEFENSQTFSFSGENPKCLAIHKMKPKGQPGGDQGWDGTDLLVYDLQSQSQINIGNVKSFSFNKSGDLLATIIDAQGKAGNGLQLLHVNNNRIELLESDRSKYGSMSWTREGDAIALLKSNADKAFENDRRMLLAFANVGESDQQKIVLDPTTDPGIPEDMTISSNRSPYWNDQRTAVFFGIEKLKKKPSAENKEDGKSATDENGGKKPAPKPKSDVKDAGLVIWHWQDPRLQSMQQKQEFRDKRRSDLCVHFIDSERTLRLGDDEIGQVSVSRPYKFAIGRDNRDYELSGNLDGRRLQDIYTIELETGKRKLALEKARFVFDVGPDGTCLLYYKNDEGHFYIYDLESGTHTNITQNVEVSFVNVDDDHNVLNPPRGPVGWTADGKHVLLTDGWDVWKVSIEGGTAVNLTMDGKTKQIRYTSPARFDPGIDGVDLSQPVYFSAYGEWTKKAGFARWMPDQAGVEMLIWEDASFGRLSKLEDHPIYSFSRSTHQSQTAYHMGGADLDNLSKMTDLSHQHQRYQWSDGVKLIDYTNSQGVKLQGALHLPANYIEGKRYPTIVYMYEKLSQRANRFDSPRTGGFSAAIYTSNGYAVFNPDIVFEINDPGRSSQDCILAGIDAAVESGVVHPDRLGLHGHSWGGYQTAFLITQTDRFKAAVAGAPLTNMISMYSSIYWNSGSANQPIFESSQGRFKGGYWDNLDAYARNSPVYYANQVTTPLLLLHNDEDGAVDWNQGIEYFNTLRRLSKPVVMLQYTGENHGLRKPENRKDYSYRMLDFFNHYLKDADSPQWWSDGIKHVDMKRHIKDYRKQKTDP